MKYELLNEPNTYLKRLRALKDFGDVKAGDLGGLIENEKNLSQEGTCWVYRNAMVRGNARVYGNAMVRGNATVSGNARVYGNATVSENARVYGNAMVSENACMYGNARVSENARVYGNAWVSENAKVYGNAWVSESARVYGNARVSENARVYRNAWVYENAKVSTTPICVIGLRHTITITETHIFIGCEGHTIKHWKRNIKKIGIKHNYTELEIKNTIKVLKTLIGAKI